MPRYLILLRFGELWLKSESVKKRFLQILRQNIRDMLDAEGIEYLLVSSRARLFVETGDKDSAIPALTRVFGITSLSHVIKTDIEGIEKEALKLAETFGEDETFAVRVRREGRHAFTSQELERNLGAQIVDRFDLKVNLTKPDNTVFVEVRENAAYIYSGTVPCAGGLPLGAEGKVLGLLTKDLDSFAAVWLIMKRGARAIAVIMDEGAKKNIALIQKFDPRIKVAEKDTGPLDETIRKYGAKAIVVPERLNTIGKHIDAGKTRPVPVFRPLVGMTDADVRRVIEKMKANVPDEPRSKTR